MNKRKPYPSDLTDEQWTHLSILLPRKRGKGCTYKHTIREICNAILYVVTTECKWRALPRDFPPPSTVYRYFYDLCNKGTWQEISDVLWTGVRQPECLNTDQKTRNHNRIYIALIHLMLRSLHP